MMTKDPVCGMMVPTDSKLAVVYQEHEVRFCSRKNGIGGNSDTTTTRKTNRSALGVANRALRWFVDDAFGWEPFKTRAEIAPSESIRV